MVKISQIKQIFFRSYKRQKSWKVKEWKRLKSWTCWYRISFSGCSHAGAEPQLKCLHENEWENTSQTPGKLENSVIVMAKICLYWVTGDIAELWDVFFISVECKMGAQERQTEPEPPALLHKFSLQINIAAYGGAAGVLVALGLLNPKL